MKRIIIAVVAFAFITMIGMYVLNPFGTSTYDPRGRIFGYVPYRMPSKSMSPTLQVGDFILVSAGAYRKKKPNINDVIVFKYPKNRNIEYVKRVIGREGDTVSITDGVVKVNGKVVDQPYVMQKNNIRTSKLNGTWTVPDGSLFVLGDNRDNSNDSRYWGYVPCSDVVGKVTSIWMSNNADRIGKNIE